MPVRPSPCDSTYQVLHLSFDFWVHFPFISDLPLHAAQVEKMSKKMQAVEAAGVPVVGTDFVEDAAAGCPELKINSHKLATWGLKVSAQGRPQKCVHVLHTLTSAREFRENDG